MGDWVAVRPERASYLKAQSAFEKTSQAISDQNDQFVNKTDDLVADVPNPATCEPDTPIDPRVTP